VGGLRYVKGHGTENDFLILPDAGAVATLAPHVVAALCDRHRGLGADGILGVVATGGDPAWYMDYRNADGSVAEMCGNGIRVFARYLVDAGLAATGGLTIDTFDGIKTLTVPPSGDVTVDMGSFTSLPSARVSAGGRTWPAIGVSLGNPHLVVRVEDPGEAGSLRDAPDVEGPDYPAGANVEFVAVRGPGQLLMRVHERGVGETRSCGTGACAAAAAATAWPEAAADRIAVEVPGGRLEVEIRAGNRIHLTGPARLVAEGEVRADWLDEVRGTR